MNDWIRFLASREARFEPDGVTVAGFAERPGDTQTSTVLCDLSSTGLLDFTGEDASTFLQGQLTCDVREAGATRSRRGALCTPKGRALATFRLWRQGDGYRMALPASLADPIRKRLSLYVLRARVRISAPSSVVCLGVAGPKAADALSQALAPAQGEWPGRDGVWHQDTVSVIALGGDRYLLCTQAAAAPALWKVLADELLESGASAWAWRSIDAADADVLPATQDQFVPQMLNLDRVGGIGFAKGCYTGQEIVARTQHLGRIKQRLHVARLPGGPAPAPGTSLYSRDFEDQASGTVLAAAMRPDGSVGVLAVLRIDTVAAGLSIHCAAPDGPALLCPSEVGAAASVSG